jgi:formylmethanofuran dehydrogenase subunit E
MPESELFSVKEVLLEPPLVAIISRPGLRSKCDRCGEEIINARQVMVGNETLCATCAGGGYYRKKGIP